MKALHFFCVLILIYSTSASAQCSFTVTASSTESRCRESGSITITPNTPGAYIYQITSGPETTAAGSSNIFNNLPSGNYTVSTTLAGCTVNTNVVVSGNYQEPGLLTGLGSKVACPNGTGCITLTKPAQGREPYSYSIIAGPQTRPAQVNNVFCGLPPGDYTVQSFDSCSVVRTTNISIANDTGNFVAYTYGYSLRYANCNDLVVCPEHDFQNTSSHSMMMIWYVTPTGDTLKVNGFEPIHLPCDTLVGQAHNYGTWQILSFDTCGRIRTSNFSFGPRGLYVSSPSPTCNGYQVVVTNQWNGNVPVGYNVYKCSNDSLVYQAVQIPPGTTFYSPSITLEYDTCYYFVHYNSCGDTLRLNNYVVHNTLPAFSIAACDGPACTDPGKGTISVYQNGGAVKPITFTIIAGPEAVGTSVILDQYSSWVNFNNLSLGTYKIEGVDACGRKDTIDVVVDEPFIRTIEITQVNHCSGGSNVHIKITSNFYNCMEHLPSGTGAITTAWSYGNTAVNIVSTPRTSTTPSVWEADYLGITAASISFEIYTRWPCVIDTTVAIHQYTAPVVSNARGYLCSSSGVGTVNLNLTGGRAPFQYRIRNSGSSSWGAWQPNPVFSPVALGNYDIELRDACPNGSITAFSFNPWTRSSISVSPTCAVIGDTVVFNANPAIAGIGYEWLFNGTVISTGPQLVIPNYQASNTGSYRLRQVFPGGQCTDSVSMVYFHCMVLPLQFGKLTGHQKNNTIQLNWNTLAESADSWFEIERSEDGTMFHTIAYLLSLNKPAGANYSFSDRNFTGSRQYYRIKYGANSSAVYSNVVSFINDDLDVKVTPVPFRNTLNVKLFSRLKTAYRVSLSDLGGKKLLVKNITASSGMNRYQWNDEKIASLPSGVYIIEFSSENNIYRQKLVKE
ncbi:MAG: T9SS type A sorting domain-containing protein [Ferruginibacter sp.]